MKYIKRVNKIFVPSALVFALTACTETIEEISTEIINAIESGRATPVPTVSTTPTPEPIITPIPVPVSTPAPTVDPSVRVDNPFRDAEFYIDPVWSEKAAGEAGGEAIAGYNTAVWMDRIGAITDGLGLRGHLDEAVAQGADMFMFVLYDLPNRNCATLASSGELRIADEGFERYQNEYIAPIKAILSDPLYADVRIVAIVEVDSLPNLVTNLTVPDCIEANGAGGYRDGIQHVLNEFSDLPNVYSYLDIANSGWLDWADGIDLIGDIVESTNSGWDSVAGFVSNASNYAPTIEPYLTDPNLSLSGSPVNSASFYQWSDYFDEKSFAQDWREAMIARGAPETIGMLIDTGRNGWGGPDRPAGVSSSTDVDTFVNESRVDRRLHRGNWCNQAAGLGFKPWADPYEGVDAFVWVKPPGESDGISDPNFELDPDDPAKRHDPICDPNGLRPEGTESTGALDNAPHAGRWFSDAFQILLQNAYPDASEPAGPPNPAFNVPLNRDSWVLSASSNESDVSLAIDGDTATRWTTHAAQSNDDWLEIDLGKNVLFNRVILDSDQSAGDYPRSFRVFVSNDGVDWGSAVAVGEGSESTTQIDIVGVNTRFLRIEQNGSTDRLWWSIHEINLVLSDDLTATPVATPVPTPVATPVPTPVATPVPTPVATPVPTPVATPVPTPVATPVPTPVATPVPTPVATPVPTPVATPVPTPVATPVPTPVATPVPTPVATPEPSLLSVVTETVIEDLNCSFCHSPTGIAAATNFIVSDVTDEGVLSAVTMYLAGDILENAQLLKDKPSGNPSHVGGNLLGDKPTEKANWELFVDQVVSTLPAAPVSYPQDPFDSNPESVTIESNIGWIEGPTWVANEGGFIYNLTDRDSADIHRIWRPGQEGTSEYWRVPGSNHGAIWSEGLIFLTNREPGRIGYIDPSKSPLEEVVIRDGLGRPNDLDRFSDGSIYFSDWPNGNTGVYRLQMNGDMERVIGPNDIDNPNGIAFTADCKRLYVADTGSGVIAFDVDEDGNLSNQRVHASNLRNVNGIAVDVADNLYVPSGDGVKVFNSDGEQVGEWGGRGQGVVNLTFGGEDHQWLLTTNKSGVTAVRTRIPGAECNGLGT